jgi:hypothetical protein
MCFPLKNNYISGKGPAQLSASDLDTIANMLNGLEVVVGGNLPYATIDPPDQQGRGWRINIPGNGLPSNAGKSKYMPLVLSADNATSENNPNLWTIDWIRAHA